MEKNTIIKSNILNSFKCTPHSQMSINELRFFCLYLSKINPKEPQKRTVEIKVKDFEKMFGVKLNTTAFSETMDKILQRIMLINDEANNRYKKIMLYSNFAWKKDFEDGIIEITANSDIMPFLWNLTGNYTSYRLSNISKLNSVSKIRLYEILCQYKNLKDFTIPLEELQDLMMVDYSEFRDFKKYALVPAVESINENTDLNVSYEKILRKRKVHSIKFMIEKKQAKMIETPIKNESRPQIDYDLLQIKAKNLLNQYSNEQYGESQIKKFVDYCIANASNVEKADNPTSYIFAVMKNCAESWTSKNTAQSYDINEFEKYAINYQEYKKVQEDIEPPTSNIINKDEIIQETTDMPLDEADNATTTEKTIIRKSEIPSELWERLSKIPNDNIEYIDDTQ